jgi:hypothetical protein
MQMKNINRYAGTFLLAVGIIATPLVAADDHDTHRYYDKQHKDYHQWDGNEQKSYTVYLNENHIQVHAFKKAKPTEQQQYWQWRHEHPDEKR